MRVVFVFLGASGLSIMLGFLEIAINLYVCYEIRSFSLLFYGSLPWVASRELFLFFVEIGESVFCSSLCL